VSKRLFGFFGWVCVSARGGDMTWGEGGVFTWGLREKCGVPSGILGAINDWLLGGGGGARVEAPAKRIV